MHTSIYGRSFIQTKDPSIRHLAHVLILLPQALLTYVDHTNPFISMKFFGRGTITACSYTIPKHSFHRQTDNDRRRKTRLWDQNSTGVFAMSSQLHNPLYTYRCIVIIKEKYCLPKQWEKENNGHGGLGLSRWTYSEHFLKLLLSVLWSLNVSFMHAYIYVRALT